MDTPSLEVPKARMDGALDSLSWWGATSPWKGQNWVGFKVPSNLSLQDEHNSASSAEKWDVPTDFCTVIFACIFGTPSIQMPVFSLDFCTLLIAALQKRNKCTLFSSGTSALCRAEAHMCLVQ